MTTGLALFEWDLTDHGLLPRDWKDEVLAVARSQRAIRTVLDGSSETSRIDASQASVCHVVTGEHVHQAVTWLDELYRTELRRLAGKAFGVDLHCANDLRAGVNINRLAGHGTTYEKHVDSNPVTGLLFVTDHPNDGALVFEPPGEPTVHVAPRAGVFLAFDARKVTHWVNPLTHTDERVSIPMNYYLSASNQPRPEDLDPYIYREAGE